MTNEQIRDIADCAANEAVRYIQDRLAQPHGDFAGLYFSDDRWRVLVDMLAAYTAAEIQEGVK